MRALQTTPAVYIEQKMGARRREGHRAEEEQRTRAEREMRAVYTCDESHNVTVRIPSHDE